MKKKIKSSFFPPIDLNYQAVHLPSIEIMVNLALPVQNWKKIHWNTVCLFNTSVRFSLTPNSTLQSEHSEK